MKKIFLGLMAALILVFCCSKRINSTAAANANINDIKIDSNITVSYNQFIDNHYILIQMVKGKYYENWGEEPTAPIYIGRIFEGKFNLILKDKDYNIISKINLNDIFDESTLVFNKFFNLKFKDYNGDGKEDFSIGQYIGSNFYSYRIFSIMNDKIIELPIEGGEMLVSEIDNNFSKEFKVAEKNMFQIKVYSQKDAKYKIRNYVWDGKMFKIALNPKGV